MGRLPHQMEIGVMELAKCDTALIKRVVWD